MTPSNEPSAVGVFDDLVKAERTLDELRQAGFPSEELGIIGHVGQEKVPRPPETQAPEDNAINGLIRGAVIGAIVGGFVVLVIPGLAAVAGLGRWFDVVGGAALGAIICGVLIAFSSFVFMRPKTRLYAAELEKGNFIVTVTNPARKDEAMALLRQRGAFVESGPSSQR